MAQQLERLHLLHCGLLPQGELTEADRHVLRPGHEERLRARLRFLDQALAITDPVTALQMLATL